MAKESNDESRSLDTRGLTKGEESNVQQLILMLQPDWGWLGSRAEEGRDKLR